MKNTKPKNQVSQTERFKQAAKELGCDEDPTHFEEKLKRIARHRPPSDDPSEPKSKTKKPGN